jgi:hypothetical protein
MFTLIRSLRVHELLTEQIPALGISLLITELFFKFHSFSLECVSFLATWYILDAIIAFLKDRIK